MSKINLIIRLQHWMDSVPGQTFLNYAYSWGASIVILGALFKLTHLPGGNMMLFIGMGTEVVVFFLSAFDRPFDKQEIGKELPKSSPTDEEIEARMAELEEENETQEASTQGYQPHATPQPATTYQPAAAKAQSHAETYPSPADSDRSSVNSDRSSAAPVQPYTVFTQPAAASEQPTSASTPTQAGNAPAEDVRVPHDTDAEQLASIIRLANDELLHRAQAVLSPEMEEATKVYIDKLNTLNETLAKVDEQNLKLTRDSEEMENLNRTLTGINKVYELHLKSISLQVGTIDDINNQTKILADQIQRLNQVYGRMIDALTVNVVRNGGSVEQPPQQ